MQSLPVLARDDRRRSRKGAVVDGWGLHGHHNNWPDDYPLVNPDERRVNVSVELLDYEPLSSARLAAALDRFRRLADIGELD